MSYFSNALKVVMQQNGINAVELSGRSKVSEPSISRLRRGEFRPDKELLSKLIEAFPKPSDRAALLVGHLQDEARGPAFNLVRIEPANGRLETRDTPTTYARLPREDEEALETIRLNMTLDQDLHEIVLHLAALFRPIKDLTGKIKRGGRKLEPGQ